MSDDKDPKSPATTSQAYDAMTPSWDVMESLLGGTETMRMAGERYAPKYAEETNDGYAARIQAATLFNMTEQTLDTLVGKPFSEPVKPGEDVPEVIAETILDDVDLQGNNLDVFARDWFYQGMAKAFAHVLVDMPRPAEREDGQPRTLEDDRRDGVRPYWVLIKPENILFARAEVIDGVEVLQHVRIFETYTEQNGFAEVIKKRIRVLEPGSVQLWVPIEKKTQASKEEWKLDEEWATGLPYIPLVTFYADRKAFMFGKPPLLDLAWLNVAHWQSTSDQRHILTVARFPMLACAGASSEDSDPVVIGPNKILYNPDAAGRFYYVEHTGAAIGEGWKDLQMLEEQMGGYGAEFLKKKPGTQTATARSLDSAEASSDLSAITVVFEDAVNQALTYTADWLNIAEGGGQIELVKDFAIEETEPAVVDFMKYLRDTKEISRVALITWAKTQSYLPEDFDEEADWEQIVKEVTERSELLGEAFGDLDPGQDKDEDEDEDKDKDKDKGKKPPQGEET